MRFQIFFVCLFLFFVFVSLPRHPNDNKNVAKMATCTQKQSFWNSRCSNALTQEVEICDATFQLPRAPNNVKCRN